MLEDLLKYIREGGTLQPAALAAKLRVSTAMVEMMLEDLERRGLLAQVTQNCSEPCGGCPMVGECAVTGAQGRMWMLRAKS
ncbi:MAG TPA: FeoC-like transcriptional regulator [Anaerolineaceae bacterium]